MIAAVAPALPEPPRGEGAPSLGLPSVQGSVDPAWAPVAEAFANNLGPPDPGATPHDGDLGAALCVMVHGRVVIDVWGGWMDVARTRPWQRDTLVNAYSIGKAVTSTTVLAAVASGRLDLDAPVASAWPEYAAHGKGGTTLRQALAHRAGVPGVRRPVADDEVFDFDVMAAALAATEPWWEPDTAHGYHVNTLGHIVGTPVARVTDRTLGQAVRDLVAGPLDAQLWIGLPRAEHHRVAEVDFIQDVPPGLRPPAEDDLIGRMRQAAYFNPQGLSGIGTVNTARWRAAQVPSTNLHADARGVARLFAALIGDRPGGGAPLLPPALVAEATSTHSWGPDLVLGRESHFGLGLMLAQEGRPIGISRASFGHYGNGGSLGFADPDAGVAFGYVMNRPGDRWQVPRTRRLLDAVGVALGAPTPTA